MEKLFGCRESMSLLLRCLTGDLEEYILLGVEVCFLL